MTDIRKMLLLNEAYTQTQTGFIKNFILDLKNYGPQAASIAYGVPIIVVPLNEDIFQAEYDKASKSISFKISEGLLNRLSLVQDNADLKGLISIAIGLYTHEDTHKQQHQQSPLFNKNYQPPVHNDLSTLQEALENVKYFCQDIEATAYGRQVAAVIKDFYSEYSPDQIFDIMERGELWENAQFMIDIYRDSLIPEKYRKKFFRALFDTLQR